MNKEIEKTSGDSAIMKRGIVDIVEKRISDLVGDGKLHLPEHYSAENALMAAWLKIQEVKDKSRRPALSVCTHASVSNSLIDMIVQGLTPAKDQCYFIVFGDKLVCLRSYFGDEALLKRIYPEARVFAEPVYTGDVLEYEISSGRKTISKHVQKLENVGDLKSIVAAYAVIELGEGREGHCEIMTLDQIKKAWSRGENWPPTGKLSAHTDHPEEFVKKTVIARACKRLINASNDSYLVHAVERQAHLVAEVEMEERIKEEGNKDVIDLPREEKKAPEPAADISKAISEMRPGKPEEGPSSPSARFMDLVNAQELDPYKARKLAASVSDLKDIRHLGNLHYEAILKNVEAFLELYHKGSSDPAGAQPKLDGAGF